MRFLYWCLAVATFSTLAYFANRDIGLPAPPRPSESPTVEAAARRSRLIEWVTLRSSDVGEIDGKEVSLAGYIVPLEDDGDAVSQFLLIPFAGGCVHTPPPPSNQMVYVQLKGGRRIRPNIYEPYLVQGTFHVSSRKSLYGTAEFVMEGMQLQPFE